MSFGVALSGIQAASGELNVVGNNIANASTTGFKSSRAEFADVYSTVGSGPLVIGNGVSFSRVSQSFNEGNISYTGKNLDLAISGGGFFKLSDGGSTVYSRAGVFEKDNQGYIVNGKNQRLTGFIADANGNITGAQGDLQIDVNGIAPISTSNVNLGVILDSRKTAPSQAWVGSPAFGDPAPDTDTYNDSTSIKIYDSLGNNHLLTVFFVKTANANEWGVRAQIDGVDVNSNPAAAPFLQTFTNSGAFDAANSDAITLSYSPLNSSGLTNGAQTPQSITINLSDSTQFGSDFSVEELSQNGVTSGRLDDFDVDESGIIYARYTNGLSRAKGQISLSNFQNPNGLQSLGDTTWGETYGSGVALTGTPGTSSLGVIRSRALEDSNVDLTAELVKMIIAQRNLQANAQTIKTADAVQQTIINIR